METESVNLNELQDFISNSTIPIIKERPTTFLGISKQPHYENVWSNIYAFFFNVTGEHNLNDLFIKSLEQLIVKEDSQYYFTREFKVDREYYTIKNGRIDLLLYSSDHAIIIENKVNPKSNNDFDDYWDSIKQSNKQGVLLSLQKIHKNNNKNFINITHLELLQCVIGNLYEYFMNANEKYLVYLKDFYQHIINMSNPIETESLEFYYKNQIQINNINKIRNAVVDHIKSQVDDVCNHNSSLKLNKPSGSNENRIRYYRCGKEKNLMFTVEFEDLINTGTKLKIYVEIQYDLLKKRDKLKDNASFFTEEEKERFKKDFYTTKENYALFATQTYGLTTEEISNLSLYISDKINNDLIGSIYKKVENILVL